jgi:SAM-dependent methyltransferase
MKLIALELIALQKDSAMVSFAQGVSNLDDSEFLDRLTGMENGEEFIERGIVNFLEADFFHWYLDEWSARLAKAVRGLVRELSAFEPATPVLEPEWTRDLLQNIYEIMVPRDLRRALGEYYTPDWLSMYLIQRTGYDGDPNKRFLDPACGSGTFLIQAINRIIQRSQIKDDKQARDIGNRIMNNVAGFDINPLAVLAARTNYLIAFARFIPHVRPINIPVYLCDSVLTPSRQEEENSLRFEDSVCFSTSKEDFYFPSFMQDKQWIDKFTDAVEVGLKSKMPTERFIERLCARVP